MSRLRAHFERRAAGLADCAGLEILEADGATTLRLRPHNPAAAGVLLYLFQDAIGTVALDDPACAPAELGDNAEAAESSIDYFIDVAVDGRATAFRVGHGGCLEVDDSPKTIRSWMNAWPLPGWRRHATRIDYTPYR